MDVLNIASQPEFHTTPKIPLFCSEEVKLKDEGCFDWKHTVAGPRSIIFDEKSVMDPAFDAKRKGRDIGRSGEGSIVSSVSTSTSKWRMCNFLKILCDEEVGKVEFT